MSLTSAPGGREHSLRFADEEAEKWPEVTGLLETPHFIWSSTRFLFFSFSPFISYYPQCHRHCSQKSHRLGVRSGLGIKKWVSTFLSHLLGSTRHNMLHACFSHGHLQITHPEARAPWAPPGDPGRESPPAPWAFPPRTSHPVGQLKQGLLTPPPSAPRQRQLSSPPHPP